MKKTLSLLLVLCLCIGVLAVPAFAEGEPQQETVAQMIERYKALYDVDGDGNLTVTDATGLLRAVAGIDPSVGDHDLDNNGTTDLADVRLLLLASATGKAVVPESALLEAFNTKLNDVKKTTKPGFTRTATSQCSSILVTASGYPLLFNRLNVTNMEMKEYVKRMERYMTGALAGDEGEAQYAQLVEETNKAYEKQITVKDVEPGTAQHYTQFPVNNFGWSSNLTNNDIAGITANVSGGKVTLTVTMGTSSYGQGQYPTDKSEIVKLPYGKAFNLPELSDSSVTLKSVKLYNGKIILVLDETTDQPITADYAFNYDFTTLKVENIDDRTVTMTVASKVAQTENYVFGDPTPDAD